MARIEPPTFQLVDDLPLPSELQPPQVGKDRERLRTSGLAVEGKTSPAVIRKLVTGSQLVIVSIHMCPLVRH